MAEIIDLIDHHIANLQKIIFEQREKSSKRYKKQIKYLDDVLEQIEKDKNSPKFKLVKGGKESCSKKENYP